MSENGIENGGRNIGRLALSLIPYALGLGAAVWLGVYINAHNFKHQLTQEDRAAAYVGATERPKSKILVEIIPQDCTQIFNTDIDGDTLMLYAQSNCDFKMEYMEWHWEAISPNNTIIASGYHNTAYCPALTTPGIKAECRMEVSTDDRIVKFRVWTVAGSPKGN